MSRNYRSLGPRACELQLLSPHALEPALCNERSRPSVRPVHCSEELAPLATTRESPRMAMRSPCAAAKTQ